MTVTERFCTLMARPDTQVALDEGALLIAAHAHPELDIAAALSHLDELAAALTATNFAALAGELFGSGAFTGNRDDYRDPRNSYLDEVLARRTGIPITLSVLMIETGRRRGIGVEGIGMPGHFLVRDAHHHNVYADPFHGGTLLDDTGCEALFRNARGRETPFSASYLDPVPNRAILSRMLANLQVAALQRDRHSAQWVTRLRLCIPDLPIDERRDLAVLLGSLGSFVEAADALEHIAPELIEPAAGDARTRARTLRSRSN